MEYEELRKGNLLFFPFTQENVEVIGVNALSGVNETYFNKLSVKHELNIYYEPIEVFKPIQLTKELLIKLGFIESPQDWFLKNDFSGERDFFCVYINKDSKGIKIYFKGNTIPLDIEFLHELQNIFYLFVKKELTFKD